MQCGLLGSKLAHTYSPLIHKYLGNYSYSLFEKSPEELEAFLRSDSFHGLNVTAPFKKAVIAYCDALTPEASRLGAVNTIVRHSNGQLLGHNTDYYGFRSMILRTGLDFTSKKVLVLGSGGASNTVCSVLQEVDAVPIVISRTGANNYHNAFQHSDAFAVINATPVGTFPDTDKSPLSLTGFPNLHCVLDLIYNPARTRLLLEADKRRIITQNGLWMLVSQAKQAAEFFTGTEIAYSVIEQIYNQVQRQTLNIILVGMPGCGKTTVGTVLAKKLNRGFADSDQHIESITQQSISTLLKNNCEMHFRALETSVLQELCKKSGYIIATGGGCVTIPENLPIIRQNSTVVWIKRELSQLAVDDRPLSLGSDLHAMYMQRAPLYKAYSEIAVENTVSAEETADQIIKLLKLDVTL